MASPGRVSPQRQPLFFGGLLRLLGRQAPGEQCCVPLVLHALRRAQRSGHRRRVGRVEVTLVY